MRKLLVLMGVSLLGTGIPSAQENGDPTTILARAVSLSQICPNTTEKVDLDNQDNEKRADHDRDQGEAVNKLSLAILFKPGRFELSYGEMVTAHDGRRALVIRFSAKPEKDHLRIASGEDKRFNWGMNRMSGFVKIDEATGGIIRIEGETPGNQEFRKWIKLAELHTLKFSLKQKLIGDRWMPESSLITLHVSKRILADQHSRYITRYHCQ
ncbi:MAG: hypothetical protein UY47_C0004G0033 [Parcubacteria group bacterium GW2011_GWB1_49_7]|nr:MAG: hypothetical protein UY47_C0004G0033 [Parcubacteria group bacterium GW2011_GWB1_49_7]